MLTTVSTPASRACSTAQPASSSISRWRWESKSVMGSDDGRRGRGGQGVAQRREAQAGRQPVQYHVEAAGLRLVLGELPGRLFLDQTVEAPHVLPYGLDGGRDRDGVVVRAGGAHHLSLIHISEPTRLGMNS